MFYSFFNRVKPMAYALLLALSFVSCHKDAQDRPGAVQNLTSGQTQQYPISLSDVLKFYASSGELQSNSLDAEKIIALEPKWEEAFTGQSVSGREILVVPLPDSVLKSINHGRAGAKLLFSKYSADSIQADLLVYVADSAWYQNNNAVFDLSTFTGALAFYDVGQHFRHAMYVKAGVPIAGTDSISTQTAFAADDRDVNCQDYTVTFITSICTDVVIALDCPELNVYINTFTFQQCTTVYTGGGGSGTGGNSGGGGSGGSNNGGNGGGNSYNPYTDFALLFNGTVPLNVFLANGGQLPEGYTSESFKQLVAANNSFKFTPRQIDSLLKHPEYIPIIYNSLFNPVGEEASILKKVLDFALTHGLTPAQFQYLLLNVYEYEKVRFVANAAGLTSSQVQWLIDNSDVLISFNQWLNNFDVSNEDIERIHRVLQVRMTGNLNNTTEAQNFLASEFEISLQQYGLTLPSNANEWTPEYWEILWDVVKEVAPELIPGLDTVLEFKNAIESASSGNWWQSSWHFAGALLTITPWDKIKDSYKFAKAIGRANRWFDLIKRCAGYSDEMAHGLKFMLDKELKNPHIFRVSPGHLPDLQPLISASGGADNLLFDVYKHVHENNLSTNLVLNGAAQTVNIVLHGTQLKATLIKNIDPQSGAVRMIISNFWKP